MWLSQLLLERTTTYWPLGKLLSWLNDALDKISDSHGVDNKGYEIVSALEGPAKLMLNFVEAGTA
jgi:hypothetical protein